MNVRSHHGDHQHSNVPVASVAVGRSVTRAKSSGSLEQQSGLAVISSSGPPGRDRRARTLLALALAVLAITAATGQVAIRSVNRGSGQDGERVLQLPPGPYGATAAGTGTAVTNWPRPGDGMTGLPAGWQPKRVVHDSLVIETAGAVVEDVEVIGGSIEVRAPNVTVRRVRVSGGGIGNWWGKGCDGTLSIDRAEILGAGETQRLAGGPVIGPGSYVARNVLIDGVVEGFRVGEATAEYHRRCGPAIIADSFVRIAEPVECRGGGPYPDWHGDGLQGYAGAGVTVIRTTIQLLGDGGKAPCDGTAPFFWPADGNGPARVHGLLVIGGAHYAFQLWTAGEVRGLLVASGYGGVEVGRCDLLSAWDAHYTAVDLQTYAVGPIGARIPCVSAA